jgi:ACT domain-containing protein
MTGALATRVEQACQDLLASRQAITITNAAVRSGISRSTLYRRPELLTVIHEHHQREHEAFTLTGLAVQIDQLRKGLETLATKVRHHEEQLRRASRRP